LTELKKVDEIKDLGVLFHPELSFVSHCKEKINRAYSMLGIIKRNFIYLTEEWRCICYIAYCVQKKNIHFFCLQNISATSLILFFAVGGHCVVDHNLNTQVSNATAISFSIIHFNPLKLYPLSENIFRKWFASYFFIYSRAFNNNLISNSKAYCYNDTFTDVRFTSLPAKKLFLCC